MLLLLIITALSGCQHQQAIYDSTTTDPVIVHNTTATNEQHIDSVYNDKIDTLKETTHREENIAKENSLPKSKKITLSSDQNAGKHKNDLAPPVIDLWQPNEAQIARGQDLIDGLCEEISHAPSIQEIERRLQSHMGLSKTQAQKVIAALEPPHDQS